MSTGSLRYINKVGILINYVLIWLDNIILRKIYIHDVDEHTQLACSLSGSQTYFTANIDVNEHTQLACSLSSSQTYFTANICFVPSENA